MASNWAILTSTTQSYTSSVPDPSAAQPITCFSMLPSMRAGSVAISRPAGVSGRTPPDQRHTFPVRCPSADVRIDFANGMLTGLWFGHNSWATSTKPSTILSRDANVALPSASAYRKSGGAE